MKKALKRIRKRKDNNKYDKLSKSFYQKVQKAFIKISKTNKKRYFVVDNSNDSSNTESIIFKKFISVLNS